MAKKKKAIMSIGEIAKAVSQIGKHQRELASIQRSVNREVEEVKTKATRKAERHQREIKDLFDALFLFAQNNRKELTEGGKKKTVSLPTGQLSWRLTPLAVSVKDKDQVVATLKRLGLDRFIRVKEELDKQAVLKESEAVSNIKGISIDQREEFVVKPEESGEEVVKKVPLKKTVKKK